MPGFDDFVKIITSPPSQLAAGAVLAAGTWKAFEKIETVLTDDTKLEIAVWLMERKPIAPIAEFWPGILVRIFERLFGPNHLSWKCFWRSCIGSYVSVCVVLLIAITAPASTHPLNPLRRYFREVFPWILFLAVFGNLIPDYLSLLKTRFIIRRMAQSHSAKTNVWLMVIDVTATFVIAIVGAALAAIIFYGLSGHEEAFLPSTSAENEVLKVDSSILWVFPALFIPLWSFLYAGAALLLKTLGRFDSLFTFLSKKLNIESKPLQSIGVVAGLLAGVAFWLLVATHWLIVFLRPGTVFVYALERLLNTLLAHR